MNANLQQEVTAKRSKTRRRRLWGRILGAMACLVVFCTTYALILPAITQETEVFCGLEAHTHGEDCYERELICTLDGGHTHDSGCYQETKTLVCPLEEGPGHTHTPECFTLQLVCTQQEREGHSHGEECWDENGQLTCLLEEDPGHAHNEDCYQEQLVCTLTEAQTHTHGDTCYEITQTRVCGLEEGEAGGHVHGADCYEEKLICTQEEHEHTLSCYSDPNGDVETAQDWERTLPEQLTGEYAQDVLAVAKSQLGYTESTRNYQVMENGTDTKGYSRYGAWYGVPYGDWCAMFVSFCLEYGGVKDFPLDASCPNWIEALKALTIREQLQEEPFTYYVTPEDYEPVPGDIIFFNWDSNPDADHVGLVYEVTPATEYQEAQITTIEGNSGERVQYVSYWISDSRILGYGRLPQQTFYCEKVGHVHDGCGSDCPLEEHIHTDACKSPLLSPEEQQLQQVIDLIEALPECQEMEEKLSQMEADEDLESMEVYYNEIYQQYLAAREAYDALTEEQQEQVTNREKLLTLGALFGVETLPVNDTLTVYQVNQYSNAVTTLVSGGSVQEKLEASMSFTYWDVIVVANQGGKLVVQEYNTADDSKSSYKAPDGGFVLLLYNTTVQAAVGDEVTVDFDYTASASSTDGLGTVSFGTALTEKPTTVEGASTRDFIEINLYDYGSNINEKYNSNENYPGFQQDNGTTREFSSFNLNSFNFGNNITADLEAGKSSVTNSGGTINTTENKANSPISGAMKTTLGADGYPALADGTSLKYLFSNNPYATKKNTQSIDGLFRHNETTGEYTFNSRENHAQFNEGSDTFTLYNQVISSNFMMYPFGNFLPFNDINAQCAQASTINKAYLTKIMNRANSNTAEEYQTLANRLKEFISLMDAAYPDGWTAMDCANEYFKVAGIGKTFTNEELANIYSIDYDEATDFYFGMEMKMNFTQPKGGYTGTTGQEPMKFYFTGDDDVWIYVDGILFLDLSGIHRHVGGEIDFVNGEVKYYTLDVETGDVSTTPYKTVKFADLVGEDKVNEKGTFKDYSSHTFNFYYMERGAGSGVCRMNFNFPLMRKNTISIAKELSNTEGVLGDPDYYFQVLKEDGTLFFEEGKEYKIYNEAGIFLAKGQLGADGIITLKAGERAEFEDVEESAGRYYVRELLEGTLMEQYDQVTVNGTAATEDPSTTQVNQVDFKGVNSVVKNISDGSTSFRFNNRIDQNKLGTLVIKKTLVQLSDQRAEKQFEFYVTLDGVPLAVGQPYTVLTDGAEQTSTRTVEKVGIITLASGETAKIPKILAGTRFAVQETSASAKDYLVTYEGNGFEWKDGQAQGVLQTNATVEVHIKNAEIGTSLEIPVTKTVTNPDDTSRDYTFCLTPADESGKPLEGAQSQSIVINTKDTGEAKFTLDFARANISEYPATFYYRITEVPEENSTGVRYDPAAYLATVTVKELDGNLTAELTELRREGEPVENKKVAFENTLVGSLTLKKQVTGITDTTTEFTFQITLTDKNGVPVTGNFPAGEESVKFDEKGQATVTLRHDQSITITDIPIGTTWRIQEMDIPAGFVPDPSFTVDEAEAIRGEATSGSIKSETLVTCVNAASYQLPATGGSGTRHLALLGGAFLTLGLVGLFSRKRREGRTA